MRTALHRLLRWTFAFCALVLPVCAIAGLTPTITLAGLPGSTVPGFPLTVSAGVFGASGPASGTAVFVLRDLGTNGTSILCGAVVLDGAGNGPCAIVTPPAGNYQIEVSYLGDGTYDPGSGTFPFSTAQASVTINLSGLVSTVPGRGLTITSNVSSPSPLGTPTGTVDFVLHNLGTNGRSTLCGASAVDGSGNSSCLISTPSSGSYEVEVNYSGDAPNATTSRAFPFTTAQAGVTITLAGLANTVPGMGMLVTSHLSSPSPMGTPTGSVDFVLHDLGTNGRSTLCGATAIDGAGNSSCSFSGPSIGTYEVEVNYSGDAPNATATQAFPFAVTNSPVVTNTNDSGAGSLRDAIDFVNANCAAQTISFNIAGAGVHTIPLSGPLSLLTCAGMTIDGYTQPGASPNTLAVGDNAVLLIEIDGTNGGDVNGILQIGAGSVTLRGLVLGGLFAPSGIRSCGVVNLAPAGSGMSTVAGNFIGTDPTGMAAHASYCGIGNFGGTEGLTIGGPSPADRNVIAGNAYSSVFLYSGNGVLIEGNYIGVNAAGNAALNASATGLLLDSGAGGTNAVVRGNVIAGLSPLIVNWPNTTVVSNLVGVAADGVTPVPTSGNAGLSVSAAAVTIGGAPGSGNVIANNSGYGVEATVPGITILGNSIYGNGQRGIDLGGAVVSNDNCDLNSSQNFPVLTSASSIGGTTTIAGSLNSRSNTTFQIEFFSNLASDNATNRVGRTFLGSTTVTTSASCSAPINVALPISAAGGNTITATATNTSTNTTGWFSNAVTVSTTAPAVSLSSASLSFGAQLLFTSSPAQTVTLTNSGTAPLSISGVFVTADFVKSTNCPLSPSTLAVGASCNINVTFFPGTAGNASGTLTITSNAVGSPHTVALSGTGIAAAPITYTISGPVSGTLNGVPFSNANITAVGLGDANLAFLSSTSYCNALSNVSFSITGVGSGSVVDTLSIFASNGGGVGGAVGFQRGCESSDWLDVFASVLGSYDLTTSVGPVPGTGSVQGLLNTSIGTLTLTSAGVLVFNGVLGAAAPAVSFSPSPLAFGPQAIGTASAPQGIVVTNAGTAPLTISSIAATGDFSVAGSCAGTMLPGDGCTLNVTFTPTATGTRGGSLVVTSNAGTSSAALSGGGAVVPVPLVTLTPTSLTFAARTLSSTSPAQTITLANTGNAPLDIASVTISGDFAFASACPAQLAALASCNLDVTFTPLIVGPRSGSVSISSNAAGSPHTASLSGAGSSTLAPVISVSPPALDFSAQEIGRDSATQIVTVGNTGTATLTFVAIVITGDYRQVALPAGATGVACPVDLAPGASCKVAVVFHPVAANLRSGVLSITTNTGAAPTTISLAGTGLSPAIPQLTLGATLSFGHQPVGTKSAGVALAIKNTSDTLATLTDLSASGDFSVSETCTTIAAGASCSPLVFFQPTQTGPRTGTLSVRSLRDADPYLVALDGIGDQNPLAVLELSATRVGFGNSLIGSATRVRLTLVNVGQAPATIESITAAGSYLVTHSCATIPRNAVCTIEVTFLPGLPGGQGGFIEIRSNAANSPQRVELSGVGCFAPTPIRARLAQLLCGP